MADYILALDIGASKIIAAIFDHRGEIIDIERVSTPRSNVERAIDHVIRRLLGRTGISYIAKAGIAAPGPINYREGVLEKPPNIDQDRVHVTDVVKRYTHHVIIANDGVAGIWAEKALVKQDLENAVLVTIGTGIGGGVIVDGRILIGSNGNAHEIGHIVVDVDSGLECGCG
ncbi:MAG: ROK family protein [Crenarchaeota archaeon]|nr:ROK family protein [Thermoproteota archaeon]